MTIDELVTLRRKAESEIADALFKFQNITGVEIRSVNIDIQTIRTIGKPAWQSWKASIDLGLPE